MLTERSRLSPRAHAALPVWSLISSLACTIPIIQEPVQMSSWGDGGYLA